jgi:hypothetical protein
VAERFLTLKPDGTYTRLIDGRPLHSRAARADLPGVEKRSSSR